MPIQGGQQLFPLQNPQATCAGFSQTWLALSLIGGGPVLNPGIIGNQRLIAQVQVTAGQPTAVSLNANGMTAIGNPVTLNNARWTDAFWRLSQCSSGYYYLTVKNPHHAMACHIDHHNNVYYLEPETGLFLFSSLGVFVVGAAAWYQAHTGQATNQQFKIYQVAPAGVHLAPATRPRPVLSAHRV